MINVFFPYYHCGDKDRQKEIDLCLQKNANNEKINKLILVIDDGSVLPFENDKILVMRQEKRLSYKDWILFTKNLELSGVSVLCNSDIYFDESITILNQLLHNKETFVALSRWEVIGSKSKLHSNPHWSQDVWALNCENELSEEFLHQLDFPMGVPRCDNKIAYLFGVNGWQIYNPCVKVKSYHVHETEVRTYHKKLDVRILGGVAYVYPGDEFNSLATLEFDVWVRSSSQIKNVSINKSLEKWLAQEKQDYFSRNPAWSFAKANTSMLLNSMKSGQSGLRLGPNFEMFSWDNKLVFKNAYNFKGSVFTESAECNSENRLKVFAYGVIPPVLSTFSSLITLKAESTKDLNFWQYPCATEKQAFENHTLMKHGDHIDYENNIINIYVPLPWATYIDRKEFPTEYINKVAGLVSNYKKIANDAGLLLKVHSVCQHIHWSRILEVAEKLGLTDLHLSHKNSKSEELQKEIGFSFKLHGWSLIAVNYVTPERNEGMERKPVKEKKLLASFIGAHMPHYLDDSRLRLFEAAKESGRDDVFVDLGNEWHFNKLVYEEQVLNQEIATHHIDEHDEKTFRYNSILSDSKFSLCPIGAGPNTLRFWESIAVGSIPVIFSDDLAIFHESDIGREIIKNVFCYKGDLYQLFDELQKTKNICELSSQLILLYEKISKRKCFG